MVPGVIEKVSAELDPQFPAQIAESIFSGIKGRIPNLEKNS